MGNHGDGGRARRTSATNWLKEGKSRLPSHVGSHASTTVAVSSRLDLRPRRSITWMSSLRSIRLRQHAPRRRGADEGRARGYSVVAEAAARHTLCAAVPRPTGSCGAARAPEHGADAMVWRMWARARRRRRQPAALQAPPPRVQSGELAPVAIRGYRAPSGAIGRHRASSGAIGRV